MIRPIDIQNKEFSKKIKGYDCDEVDDFLDAIIQDYETLGKENQALKDRLALMTKTIEHYKQLEETMQKSLEVARQSADDIRNNTNIEAQTIISKAKLDAARLSKQIDEEHIRKHQEMLNVKSEVEQYKLQVKSLCSNMIKMMDNID
ncbi:MAG: DivIVA domain-containing protein [Oscillospiraceae bacterium]|nr:DivIVA domain-containing protein [Oscillospiraceae bacterium]